MVSLRGTYLLSVQQDAEKLPLSKTSKKRNFLETYRKCIGFLKLSLSKERQENTEDYFLDQEVNFDYPTNVEDINYLIDVYNRRKSEYVENDLGEKMIFDKLIVMDEVSGLADKSEKFANFLTVSIKYGITCIYIFHTIHRNKQNWQMILSQTQTYNFFPGSV